MTCNRPKKLFFNCVIWATAEKAEEWRKKNECGQPAVVSIPLTLQGHKFRINRCEEHAHERLKE